MMEQVKKYAFPILAVIFALLFLAKGCTGNKISKMDKKLSERVTALEHRIDSLISVVATEKEIRDQMERVMLDFLIYEDDLDKGKTSLSSIKDKIESND